MLRLGTIILCCALLTPATLLAQNNPDVRTMGVAISAEGKVFHIFNVNDTEEVAKEVIQATCEIKTKGPCISLSVPMTWDVVVLQCKKNSDPPEWFLGGSEIGFARRRAVNKANDAGYESTDCKDLYVY